MTRSKKANFLAKTRKVLNSSLKMLESLYRKGSNTVLSAANKGMKQIKNRPSKRTRRKRH